MNTNLIQTNLGQVQSVTQDVDRLKIALIMIVNALRNTQTIEVDGQQYKILGSVPEGLLNSIEIIITNNKTP